MTRIDYASAGVGGEPWGPIGFRWSARSIALIGIVLAAGVWLRLRHSPYTAVTVLPVAPFFMAFHDNERLVTADTPAGVRVWDVRTSRLLENPIRRGEVYYHPRSSWLNPNYVWNEKSLWALRKGGGVQQVRPGYEPMISELPVTSVPGSNGFPIHVQEKYNVTMSVDHPSWRVYLRDHKTGAIWHSVRIFFNYRAQVNIHLSPDGRTLAVVSGSGGARVGETYFYDMASESMRAYYDRDWSDINFLPGSEEFFCFDPRSKSHAVFRVGSAEPLAILPDVESSGACPPVVSPDGRWLACGGPNVARGTTVLKRTGWDCPPSPKGMLAFPATWLLASSLTGAAWSLRRDAKRVAVKRRGGGRWWRRLVGGCVFGVLVVLTLHALAVVGLGRRPPMTPAPVLLIGWIGLGTGSRFWRLTAMVVSAGGLAWCMTCLAGAWKAGWSGTVTVELLDRVYVEPRATGLIALVIGTVASGIAVAWLASTLGASESALPAGASRTDAAAAID